MSATQKHTMDHLFHQKLKGHKVEPSSAARELFLASLNQGKKKKAAPIWYYSAAASVLFILGFAWYVMDAPQANIVDNQVSSVSVLDRETLGIEPEALPEELLATNTVGDIKPLASPQKPTVIKTIPLQKVNTSQNLTLAVDNSEAPKEEYQPVRTATGVIETDELIQDQLTLALQKSEQRRAETVKESETEGNTGLFQKSVGETLVIESSSFETFDDIYIPSINSDSRISLEEATFLGEALIEQDRSLIAKVFTELRHLKHGEKVDLNALSENNATFVSNEDTFIGHETMQMRQRFNWIKGRFSRK